MICQYLQGLRDMLKNHIIKHFWKSRYFNVRVTSTANELRRRLKQRFPRL